MPEPAVAQRVDRALTLTAVTLGMALALVVGRVAPDAGPAPRPGGGAVVIRPLGLVPTVAPVGRR
jgi:hypothetical protein